MKITNHKLLLAGLASLALTQPNQAGEPAATETAATPGDGATHFVEPNTFDKIWGLATLYKNDSNPFLQEFKLRGRYHGQYHWLDSDQGNQDDWEDRRSRFGFDAKLFEKKIEVRADFESNDGFEDLYSSLVDAYVKWKPSDSLSVTVGRQKPLIGYYDWLQSTNAQPTFERSQIFNQLRINRATGATVEGKIEKFTWQAGVYSNDINEEFGNFDGGVSFTAGFGYDFKHLLDTEKADWRLDWLHSEIEANDTVLNRYADILSTTFWLKEGHWALVTEAFYGTGGQGRDADVFGFYIQPTYDLIPKRLQLVGRYSFSTGDGPDAVIAQSRYERLAPELTGGGRGETYNAGYLGLQYFIYGDKLKLMAGAELASVDGGGNGGDFDGVTYLTGLRFSF